MYEVNFIKSFHGEADMTTWPCSTYQPTSFEWNHCCGPLNVQPAWDRVGPASLATFPTGNREVWLELVSQAIVKQHTNHQWLRVGTVQLLLLLHLQAIPEFRDCGLGPCLQATLLCDASVLRPKARTKGRITSLLRTVDPFQARPSRPLIQQCCCSFCLTYKVQV